MRDGQWSAVPAGDLVPGDLIVVERGDVVPADGRVVAGTVEAGSRSPVTSRCSSPARAAGCDPPGPRRCCWSPSSARRSSQPSFAAAGLLMAPLGWGLIALAWGYAIVWIVLLDELKLIAYGALERRTEPRRAPLAPPRADT